MRIINIIAIPDGQFLHPLRMPLMKTMKRGNPDRKAGKPAR